MLANLAQRPPEDQSDVKAWELENAALRKIYGETGIYTGLEAFAAAATA